METRRCSWQPVLPHTPQCTPCHCTALHCSALLLNTTACIESNTQPTANSKATATAFHTLRRLSHFLTNSLPFLSLISPPSQSDLNTQDSGPFGVVGGGSTCVNNVCFPSQVSIIMSCHTVHNSRMHSISYSYSCLFYVFIRPHCKCHHAILSQLPFPSSSCSFVLFCCHTCPYPPPSFNTLCAFQ